VILSTFAIKPFKDVSISSFYLSIFLNLTLSCSNISYTFCICLLFDSIYSFVSLLKSFIVCSIATSLSFNFLKFSIYLDSKSSNLSSILLKFSFYFCCRFLTLDILSNLIIVVFICSKLQNLGSCLR